MLKILFAAFTFIVAICPWGYLLWFGGFAGGGQELEEQVEQYKQEVMVEKQKSARMTDQVSELEEDVQAYRSKLEFFEESIVKTEGRMNDTIKERDALNEQIKQLRAELTDVENRLLDETNRANTLDSTNEMIAGQLDKSIQEVRRLQTIIRTLSQD